MTRQRTAIRDHHARTPWLEPVVQRMAALVALPEGWDSYGAPALDAKLLFAALDLLARTMSADTPAPAVIPTSQGGVQLEWHRSGIDLEVEVLSPNRFDVSYRDRIEATEWDREFRGSVRPLQEALSRLTQRERAVG